MNHIKQFFKEKGLYLFCLAMVFAATAAGILALRSIVGNVADLTRLRKEALQDDTTWTQPDTAIDKPPRMCPSRRQRPPPHRRLNRARPHHPPRAPPRRRRPQPLASGTPSRWQHSAGMNWCTVRRWATGAPTTARTTLPRQGRVCTRPRRVRLIP